MQSCNIIYADLSTYTPKETIRFYAHVFSWKYSEKDAYHYAYMGDRLVAGLYKTPEKFRQMRMPHFWMTYIQVSHLDKVLEKAHKLGGIVEMENLVQDFGRVALIRDPQGAGFTVYEGENLQSTRTQGEANTLIWNELHISKADKIIGFYENLFEWAFHKRNSYHFNIHNNEGQHIADALEISNQAKGKYEYWVCTFGVKNMKETKSKILEHGGSLVMDEGERILFTDNSGQAFFYIQEIRR